MKKFVLLLSIVLISANLKAQSATDVVNSYLQAIGGRDKWKTIRTLRIKGNIKANGMEFPIVILQKGTQKFKSYISFQGMDIVQPAATDGKVVWSTSITTMENELMIGDAADAIKREARDFPEALLTYATNGYKIELGEDVNVGDRNCHSLALVKPDQVVEGQEISGVTTFIIDKESKLIIQKIQNNAMGTIITNIGDYRSTNGVLYPYKLTTEINGNVVSDVIMESYEPNAKIDDILFSFPK
jgi:hypothetical protein